jgi:hypothetical protein
VAGLYFGPASGEAVRMALCHPERKHAAKDLCRQCDQRRRRGPARPPLPLLDRVEAKIDKSAGPEGCWPWLGAKGGKGMLTTTLRGKSLNVRRVIWEAIHGPVPAGMTVGITCDHRGCANPIHFTLIHFRSDAAVRFWSHVDKSAGPEACWPWKDAASFRNGYGMFRIGWKKPIVQASRHSYEITHDVTLATEQFVMHTCDNPPCCNPAHLRLGDALLNHRDMVSKGRASWQVKKAAGHT